MSFLWDGIRIINGVTFSFNLKKDVVYIFLYIDDGMIILFGISVYCIQPALFVQFYS